MSYQEDSIEWQIVRDVDEWLDEGVAQTYKDQPLAQDWARVSKIAEELGEAIEHTEGMPAEDLARINEINKTLGKAVDALIRATGQNPRKGTKPHGYIDVVDELADTALTAILAIQHFVKDTPAVRDILRQKQDYIYRRMMNAKEARQ